MLNNLTKEEVINIQEKLKRLGLFKPIINGIYGDATTLGVKIFQQQVGLEPTGIADAKTLEELNKYTENPIMKISVYPTLKLGSSGEEVRDLQTKLKALLYYPERITGDFDLATQNAVKRLQVNTKLTADGIVGNNTWDVINDLYGNLSDCALTSLPSSDTDTYIVQSGDTLYGIAQKFNTTIDAIKNLNNLTSNTLRIGEVLKIPTTAQDDYTKYIVQAGDTLYGIALKYNTTVDEIKSLNNLTSNVLQIGQVLNIPTSNTSDYINYVVVRGDTLYAIARKYNVSVDTLKSLNNLTSNILTIGEVLKIPTEAGTNYLNYTVVSGDSLYRIALKYNTTVDEIKSLNNLTSNILQIGQILKIPV